MSSLLRLLGIDRASKAQRRANALVKADLDFMRDLVQLRKSQGLSQKDVADRIGIAQASVAAFERYDNDPKLSTIRRYSHAVEALVAHAVTHDDGQLANGDGWVTISFAPVVSKTAHSPSAHEHAFSAARGRFALAS
jgi:transcriptional regulator with XRE-family HTH domain